MDPCLDDCEVFMMKKETIYGEVIAKANHYLAVPDSAGGKRIIKDDAIRSYETSFVRQCVIYKDKFINAPFGLVIDVYYSSNRFDLDNSLKTILDCLQMCRAISNDNLCMKIEATKHIDRNTPRVVFGIIEYEPNLFEYGNT